MTNTMTKTNTNTNTYIEHPKRVTLVTCDIWDTDYISDNWEHVFLTIYVTWQLRVTLDSIRNSCDVYICHLGFVMKHNWQIQIQNHKNKSQLSRAINYPPTPRNPYHRPLAADRKYISTDAEKSRYQFVHQVVKWAETKAWKGDRIATSFPPSTLQYSKPAQR